MAKKEDKSTAKDIARNRRARYEYEVLETFEVGIELTGTEVRSLRENNCQLTDCFALIRKGEVWLHNVHIPPFSQGNIANVDPDRKRKLLLHRKQIRYLDQKVAQQGMALVPLRMYFNDRNLDRELLWLGCTHGFSEALKEETIQYAYSHGFKEVRWINAGGVITTHGGSDAFCISGYRNA